MEPVNALRKTLFAECYPSPVDSVQALHAGHVSEELKDVPGGTVQVVVMEHPNSNDLRRKLEELRPEFVYFTGGCSAFDDLLNTRPNALSFPEMAGRDMMTESEVMVQIFRNHRVETLYIDAPLTPRQVEALLGSGCCENLVYWPCSVQMNSATAAQFAHCFVAMMRNPGICFKEAFAMATRSVRLLCENIFRERPHIQLLPSYVSRNEPELPHRSTVPLEPIPNVQFLEDDVPDVDGWEEVLLLAPKAEVRLLVCGGPTMIDAARLSLLGEALRALLLTEMRSLTVISLTRCDRTPANIAGDSTALRCHIKCASGVEAAVVLGGPPSVLSNRMLVQHALRQTLSVDSLCLQFRLPPPSFPPTTARSAASVAGGTPVVDTLVVTSVWAAHILRGLCQDRSYRGLISFGIAGVGGSALTHFRRSDTVRYNTITTGMQSQPLMRSGSANQEGLMEREMMRLPRPKTEPRASRQNGDTDMDLIESLDNDSDYDVEMDPEYDVSSKTSHDRTIVQTPNISAMDYHSTRPPLERCSEDTFYDDLVAFLEAHHGKAVDRERFPEAVLNGAQLDLFNLYKEVVSRGGFRVGNGINWKGQVFPKMRNWTANHKMTGVGNALKRHYQVYLCEYEMVHPKDLTGDGCSLCGSNDESGTDWICCDSCERWIHFACDRRPSLGTFKEYATGDGGRTYHCPRCSDAVNRS